MFMEKCQHEFEKNHQKLSLFLFLWKNVQHAAFFISSTIKCRWHDSASDWLPVSLARRSSILQRAMDWPDPSPAETAREKSGKGKSQAQKAMDSSREK